MILHTPEGTSVAVETIEYKDDFESAAESLIRVNRTRLLKMSTPKLKKLKKIWSILDISR